MENLINFIITSTATFIALLALSVYFESKPTLEEYFENPQNSHTKKTRIKKVVTLLKTKKTYLFVIYAILANGLVYIPLYFLNR